jgi:poly(3-hydroxybutyrate) depolymerase
MDADYYLETIDTVFQEFKLVRGTWEVKSAEGVMELVRPQDIRNTALLTVEGELDDISGSGQTKAAHKLCSGIPDKDSAHLEAKGAGHYGIFSGRRWRDVVYPVMKEFIAQHNKPHPARAKATQPKLAKASAKSVTTKRAAVKVAPAKSPAKRVSR